MKHYVIDGGEKEEAFMYECGRTPGLIVKWKKSYVKRVF